ncbi:dolichyl-phosphate-mannose--protein mannosyltransferase [Jatrophihabitans sp. DSM 45814]
MPTATLLPEEAAPTTVVESRQRPDSLTRWRPDSLLSSWLWTFVVTAIAAVTRFWALGFPHEKSFDEVYYATEAQELLRYGYEDNRGYMFIVHPSVGKWLIAFTSAIWGNNSLGWRVAPALAGTISVLILTRVAMRMFRSVLLGVLAGTLLSLDGISLVMSRVALLDIFLQVFILAGFAALVLDREQLRGRLGDLYAAGVDLSNGVPSLGPRPWRLIAGVMFGLSFGVKWSALSFWVGFAVMSLFWDRGALKAAGVEMPWIAAVKRSWLGAFFSLGVAGISVYFLTWMGWFAGENSWNRHWGDTHPGNGLFALLPSGFRSLLDYHHQAYIFHSTLYSPHAYKANPWSWLVLGRPISFYYPSDPSGCGAFKADGTPNCAREILLIGTPLMYWAILPALVWLAWHWATTRDWRAGAIGMAFIAGWGVWLHDQRRTGFLFYMTPLMPYLMLALTMAVAAMLARTASDRIAVASSSSSSAERHRAGARADAATDVDVAHDLEHVQDDDDHEHEHEHDDGERDDEVRTVGLREWIELRGIPMARLLRTAVVVIWLGVVVADFIWMWPIFTGGMLTYDQWSARMWFPSWI